MQDEQDLYKNLISYLQNRMQNKIDQDEQDLLINKQVKI
ncbi:hypothetical protein MHK_003704 [Candidatus Magnetomorum sp. HK-1]|nr:hypothetical protein MHK_003704 [Candidatus Magnetomorum sp. HK-1]